MNDFLAPQGGIPLPFLLSPLPPSFVYMFLDYKRAFSALVALVMDYIIEELVGTNGFWSKNLLKIVNIIFSFLFFLESYSFLPLLFQLLKLNNIKNIIYYLLLNLIYYLLLKISEDVLKIFSSLFEIYNASQ